MTIENDNNENINNLTVITNEILDKVRNIEYLIVHFMNKTNKANALNVRNELRHLNNLSKDFKDITIKFFN